MRVAVLVLEKEAMVFLFAEMALQDTGEKIDKGMDLLLGEALAQKISKLSPAGQL
jgi:hypothetical protein